MPSVDQGLKSLSIPTKAKRLLAQLFLSEFEPSYEVASELIGRESGMFQGDDKRALAKIASCTAGNPSAVINNMSVEPALKRWLRQFCMDSGPLEYDWETSFSIGVGGSTAPEGFIGWNPLTKFGSPPDPTPTPLPDPANTGFDFVQVPDDNAIISITPGTVTFPEELFAVQLRLASPVTLDFAGGGKVTVAGSEYDLPFTGLTANTFAGITITGIYSINGQALIIGVLKEDGGDQIFSAFNAALSAGSPLPITIQASLT